MTAVSRKSVTRLSHAMIRYFSIANGAYENNAADKKYKIMWFKIYMLYCVI